MEKCRLCYTDPDPEMCQHIFNTRFKPPIWKIIKHLSNLKITKNDPHTKTICGPCFFDLVKYNAFRRKILATDYRIQHAEQLLSEKTCDDHDYFLVHCTPTSSDSDDFMVKEEQIEIEEHPLVIDNEIKEELNDSGVAVINNQNIKELTIVDGIYNNDKITACFTSPEDNSNETNERQSVKSSTDVKIDFNRDSTETDGGYTISTNNNDLELSDNDMITCDGNEISTVKDSSNIFDNNSSCTSSNNNNNGKRAESANNRRKDGTRNSQRLNYDNSIDTKGKTTKKNSENTKKRRKTRNDLNIDLKVRNNKTETDERHKQVHTDKKSYRCDICDKQFSQKAYLGIHQRVHTGEKPFKCTICNKQYTLKSSLVNHEQIHMGEKPFKCKMCNKQFLQRANLWCHVRRHLDEKPIKCNICDKNFSTRSHLKDHINIHTGEKPYCCDICDKTFSFKSYLNIHLKAHRDGVPINQLYKLL